MSLMAKIILAVAGLLITAGLLYYAKIGRGLTANGKKLVRGVAAIFFVIIALVVIFEQTI